MKKLITLLIIVSFTCTGCALAAGALAGGITAEIIEHTIGSGKSREKIECSTCVKSSDKAPREEMPKEGNDQQKDATTQR